MKERDNHPADLIAREILSKGKKALVIYGAVHMGLFGAGKYFNLRAQIDAKQPGAWFVIVPYVGYLEKPCTTRFERDTRGWREPALAQVTGALKKNGCCPLAVASSTCRPTPTKSSANPGRSTTPTSPV